MEKALAEFKTPFTQVDVSAAIAMLLSVKDEDELKTIRLAARISSATMKTFFPQMSAIIDEGKNVSHEKLMELQKIRYWMKLEAKSFDFRQIGGVYDLRPSAASNKDPLHEGVIICSIGVRYKTYCSNVGRTFLMNPTQDQESNYKILCDLQSYLLSIMKDGILSNEVYIKALDYIQEKRPDLKAHFTKNCGFVDSSTQKQRFKEKLYSLYLADTVQITNGTALVLSENRKDLGSISYAFGDDEEDDEVKIVENLPKTRGGAVIESKLRHESDRATAEQRRRLHQQLAQSRQEEGLSRYSENKDDKLKVQQAVFRKFESYRKDSQLPRNINELKF
ncbi:hypothetical protein BSLG_005727 [Batrachochytrium salamandrivorans]|nr:hypothetical protein BSLG_005727 [Batrachochytrium salamandrivorans]